MVITLITDNNKRTLSPYEPYRQLVSTANYHYPHRSQDRIRISSGQLLFVGQIFKYFPFKKICQLTIWHYSSLRNQQIFSVKIGKIGNHHEMEKRVEKLTIKVGKNVITRVVQGVLRMLLWGMGPRGPETPKK